MTYEQFWHMDVNLCQAYRKAEELRNEKRNQELWFQGMYIYEALCDVAPVLRAFAKKNTKPHPYPSQPYPLKSKEKKDQEKTEKQKMEKMLARMEAYTTKMNGKLNQQKGGTSNG